jgi:hypothetical protein
MDIKRHSSLQKEWAIFRNKWKWFVMRVIYCWAVTILFVILAFSVNAEEIQLKSKWDENILNIEINNVNIRPNPIGDQGNPQIVIAWEQIITKYFLRANIYLDPEESKNSTQFAFKREHATGRELFDAFLAAYPTYTYVHDSKTGVIWFYPTNINYDNILNDKVEINRSALQVPMYSGVLQPLCDLLKPTVVIDLTQGTGQGAINTMSSKWNNSVDLPVGVYSACDIINICCVATPNLAFCFDKVKGRTSILTPFNLVYDNPLALEREAAIRFWETEIGGTTNAPPSPEAIAAALSDDSPRKRWAAREYHKATLTLSHGIDNGDPKISVWQALGWKAIRTVGAGDYPFLKHERMFADKKPTILNDLLREDSGLALITSMELARETKDPGIMDVVASHKFTVAEIAKIKPDVYRIARESKLVRDKLLAMSFNVPDLSPEALSELANTNLFTLVPAKPK